MNKKFIAILTVLSFLSVSLLVAASSNSPGSVVKVVDVLGKNSPQGLANSETLRAICKASGFTELSTAQLDALNLEFIQPQTGSVSEYVFSSPQDADAVGDYFVLRLQVDLSHPQDPVLLGGRLELSDD